MGRAKWTPSLLNSLLMHIEEHKGENGLYSTNTEAAYKDAANLLTKTFPMTPEQVKNKLTHLFEGDNPVGHEKKALFLKGRCVLRAPYDKATTLDPQGRTSLSNTHDHEDTNPDEPCEEPPARISRDNVTQVEVIRSFNNDQHSRGLSLSLNPDERQQLSSDLSSLRSDESEYSSSASFFHDGNEF